MLTFEEAKKKARKLEPRVNNCTETLDAFIFGISDSTDIGEEPIVVMKNNGKVISITGYLDKSDKTEEIKDWGEF